MGFVTTARCGNCGYSAELPLGATRSNFASTALWPIYCAHCQAIGVANYMCEPLECGDCKGTDVSRIDSSHMSTSDGQVIHSWGFGKDALSLTDGRYRCPKCDKIQLRFDKTKGILFD